MPVSAALAAAIAALATAHAADLAAAEGDEDRQAINAAVGDGLPTPVRTALNNAGFSAGRADGTARVQALEQQLADTQARLTEAEQRASTTGDAAASYETTIRELREQIAALKAERTEATRTASRTSVLADVRAALAAKAKPIAVRALMGDADRRVRIADDGTVTVLRDDLQTHLIPTSTQTPAQALAADLILTLEADDLLSTVPQGGAGTRGVPGGEAVVTEEELRRRKRQQGSYGRL